ncbi:hypothetical protein L1887_33912 [Cichorium endivia]|nr:hypothetical protein L1887_33912 [Cichorium endivia]
MIFQLLPYLIRTPISSHITSVIIPIGTGGKAHNRHSICRETLTKELDCITKAFKGSFDFKELHFKTGEILSKLDNKIISPEDVCTFVIQFFNYVVSEFPQNIIKPGSELVPIIRGGGTSAAGGILVAERIAIHNHTNSFSYTRRTKQKALVNTAKQKRNTLPLLVII